MKLHSAEFEKLALEQMDLLYRVACRLTHEPTAAEDLVQETYLRAFRGSETFDLQTFGIRPWLIRILHNLHINRSVREKRQPASVSDEQLQSQPSDGELLPLAAGSLDGMDEHLVRALRALPAEYQSVMLLWAVEELSYKEIAVALEVPIGTVMSRLHRARQKLSEQLRQYAVRERIIRE